MKKIKIMLTAITVLAVVGGALAFKAKKIDGVCLYTSSQSGACAFSHENFTTTTEVIGSQVYATTKDLIEGDCPSISGVNCNLLTYTKGEN